MTRSAGAWIRRLSAEPAGEGFFWYADHGVQAAGENYLLPVDIDAEDEAALIYGSYPLEQTVRNKLNLVVLDACRAGTAGPFSTGERISTAQANYNGAIPYRNDNRGLFRKTTTPAASLSPGAWGLYDMHGNVWLPGKEDEEGAVNPPGPASGAHRVNRGGGWDSPARELRSAARSSNFPETAGGSLGFRLARNGP
jgi:hypothetical protein